MIQPGTILGGHYEIMNHIGSGGMADVYKARCHKLNRYVAIKVLRDEYNDDENFVKRFIAEAKATTGIKHPNIVAILDAGNDMGYHYIVMELCEGTTLKRYIRRYGRISVRETVDFSKQIARGIQAAHQAGIVHRDIKPQNILVSESGNIKVTDFGIAKATTGDTISQNTMGSVHYLSPEQARGRFADQRSDIYSLGITMYEMATGKVPFDGENSVTIALMHLKNEITPPRCFFPDIPASLEKIILKCTMKRPLERYQNVQELLDDLELVFTHPDGEFVFAKPLLDDGPTVLRTKEEIDQIKKSMVNNEHEEETGDGSSEEENKTVETDDEADLEEMYEDDDEDLDDEEDMQPHMRRMIYVITAVGGLLLAGILIYLITSSTGILRLHKQESTTQEEATTTATTEATKVSMPSVLKKDKDTAEQILTQYNLKANFIYESDVSQLDDNLVVTAQQYSAGEQLAQGTTVTLTLGMNPDATTEEKRVEVPALVNMSEEEAEEALSDAGLNSEKVYATSDSVQEGYVIKQNPTAGTEVDRGFTITITISKGVSQVRVPDLVGLSESAAREQLNNVGLELGEVTSDYSGDVGIGEVFEQGTDAGTMVDKGTTVDVTISLGDDVSYHYEGEVYIVDSPFPEGESGTLELELEQNGKTTTIYSESDVSSDDFPFDYTFDGEEEGEATVIVFANGKEYTTQTVQIEAVED